ncbi:MAG: hypothetical protein H6Q15_680 [Bacteroidetes bacterium]|nr:hypothetical protein [Bacteroidota bacterium]
MLVLGLTSINAIEKTNAYIEKIYAVEIENYI